MSTTLKTAPPFLSLAYDPMMFGVKASNAFASLGIKAQLKISITGSPTVANKFTIDFNGISQSFTCAAAPNDSGLQYTDNAGALSTAAWAETVFMEDLRANYYLSTYFDFEFSTDGGTFIILTAKQVGEDYTLVLVESLSWMAESTNTAGVNQALQENHRVLLDLKVEDEYLSGNFDKIIRLDAPIFDQTEESTSGSGLDALNCAWFNAGPFLRGYFQQNLPSLLLSDAQVIAGNAVRFKISHAEQYGATSTPKKVVHDADTYIGLNGGSKHPFRFENTDLWVDYLNGGKFLTWSPTTKHVGTSAAEFLHLFINAAATYRLQTKITYTDGTADAWTEIASIAATQHQVLCFPIGYSQMIAAEADSEKTVLHYQIRVTDAAAYTTEVRKYYIDHLARIDDHTLYFFNSFGVLDCERFLDVSKADSFANDQIQGTTNAFATRYDFEKRSVAGQDTQALTLTSEPLTNARAEYMRELLRAEYAYLLQNNDYVPVIITARSIDKYATKGGARQATISIEYSNTSQHHSA